MPDLFAQISPAWALFLSGLICAVVPVHTVRKLVMVLAPLAAFLLFLAPSTLGVAGGVTQIAGMDISTYRLDRLSYPFGLVFILAAFLTAIFAWHNKDRVQDVASQFYAGSALGAVFAGDFLTLFVFWEITAIASVFLIFRRGTTASRNAGMRYLVIQVLSGVLLLAGAVMLWAQTGSLAFDEVGLDAGLAGWLVFLAFGIKCAFPFLHNWLQDAYPQSTVTGGVILSAFTTKMAVYALARGFAGEEILIWIGAIMTLFPIFFAVIEDDLRRVLSYSINNQVGFMVVGVGVGTSLALNGAVAHAFADVIFKALLFMSIGAVLMRTGTARVSQLGGLFKSMPLSAFFCIIGAASISALPLLSAFVTKSMILAAVAEEGHWVIWLILIFASAGVLEHAGIKIPYSAFFGHDSGRRPAEAPFNMLLAMGLAAALCIALAFPWGGYQWLYAILPYNTAYNPYTWDHVLTQYQLLFGATAAFVILRLVNLAPHEKLSTILDFDWVYRKLGYGAGVWIGDMAGRLMAHLGGVARGAQARWGRTLGEVFTPGGAVARALPSGTMSIWTAILLGVALVIAYVAA